ncbi:Oidioi.mRNA.OKI2018_I69.PAR.g10045.t1.cds [Oikopleura dioica]|uniref:Oidioi.mRNA.OKI2018_I69.PAR.g10045.t1.cds n=1 Tax=Oikopleura dioica TaxID=34765 RepID=A0ABN7RSA6_OIKDI|nr:Oidioi.mRNA.OKI2018_I69.PAR.g10045.t1.cds [Oikopleura dioica]
MRFIALSCLSSAVFAILDMNQLMALKNQAADSTMQSSNRCEFDKCMKCLAVLKKKDTTKRSASYNEDAVFGCTMMWVWPDCCPQWQNMNFLS